MFPSKGLWLVVVSLLAPERVLDGLPPTFVVWNVGQGLWTTLVTATACHHYDVGGERAVRRVRLSRLCHLRSNSVHFTHWDQDHIRFAMKLRHSLPNTCLRTGPGGLGHAKKQAFLVKLPRCHSLQTHLPHRELKIPRIPDPRRSNELSRVFLIQEDILVPGDSHRMMEKIWAAQLPDQLQVFVLGHHGSKTSTGPELLEQLQRVRTAVASSRQSVYGHPHGEVLGRLRQKKIPVLKTEDWDHIQIQLNLKGRYSIPRSRATGS